jgi:hypothetical protein
MALYVLAPLSTESFVMQQYRFLSLLQAYDSRSLLTELHFPDLGTQNSHVHVVIDALYEILNSGMRPTTMLLNLIALVSETALKLVMVLVPLSPVSHLNTLQAGATTHPVQTTPSDHSDTFRVFYAPM